jgi:perosamine synthetase
MIKLFQPYVSWQSIANTVRVLRSGQLNCGDEVKLFENEFAKKFLVENVVALNSGTSALELAYELAGLGEGDEVITPVLTCTATNIPLVRRKCKIVFADIDYDLNINLNDVKKKITEKTKAIVFVHFGGNPRGLDDLVAICRERNIKLIEDAAQAVGNNNFGKGDFTCISLQAIKTITSGDGGFIICRDNKDYEKAKRLRWFGYDREKKALLGDTNLYEAGYKYEMNNIAAAIGRGNLAAFDKIMKHKNKLAEIYRSYGLFVNAWLATGFTDSVTDLKTILNAFGIEIGQHHYRNDKYAVFGAKEAEMLKPMPVMDELEFSYFFVPYHMGISEADAHFIGGKVKEFSKKPI